VGEAALNISARYRAARRHIRTRVDAYRGEEGSRVATTRIAHGGMPQQRSSRHQTWRATTSSYIAR